MKPFFIILSVIAVIFVCIVVAGVLMFRKKDQEEGSASDSAYGQTPGQNRDCRLFSVQSAQYGGSRRVDQKEHGRRHVFA